MTFLVKPLAVVGGAFITAMIGAFAYGFCKAFKEELKPSGSE